MNKLLIIANTSEKRYQESIKEGIFKLNANGFECVLLDEDYKTLYKKEKNRTDDIENIDYVCSIGGDGSFLFAGKYAIKYDKPIFGINYGQVGYLCVFDKKEIDSITPKRLKGKKITKQTILECSYQRKKYYAINDVIVGKENFGETISLKALLNDEELCAYRGDGIIVSSKTGSSAYNKSCGAPIINKKGKFIVTAICPSNTSFRYKIIGDNKEIKITLVNKRNKAGIYCDGKKIGILNSFVTIRKSNKELKAIL